jgi:SsrA-binding protein
LTISQITPNVVKMPVLINNKKAGFEYTILETYQAGLSLSSKMVKQVRSRRVTIEGKYVIFQQDKLMILDFGNDGLRENVPLLLKKKEIDEISGLLTTKGYTCILLNVKTIGRWIKSEIAIVKGKKNFDKKSAIKSRDIDRDLKREMSRF